jgi:hypothetical protein
MNFKEWLILTESFGFKNLFETDTSNNDISPITFRNANVSDIIDFVEELLYKKNNIDITEKMAGQHLTVTIKDNLAYTSTKDSLLQNKEPKNAIYSKYGSSLTSGIIEFLKETKIPNQIWRFEILHPSHNHDYIKYKNTEQIYVEYSGNLSEDVAKEIRKHTTVKILTKNDIKINLNQSKKFQEFKKEWENKYKSKLLSLDPNRKGNYYNDIISEIKYKIGDLIEDSLVSAVDKTSPVEGVVVGTKNPIKIQTNTFLKVQRVQMPLFSVFKISRDEIPLVLKNPTTTFEDLKKKYNLKLNSIYTQNLNQSLFTTVRYYLMQNNKLIDIDQEKYKQWLKPEESKKYLDQLAQHNIEHIYQEIYDKVL